MEKSYIEYQTLRTCDCDMGGGWRPAATLTAMQETAAEHCRRLGIGRAVTDGQGVIWVLSRSRVVFSRVPKLYERVGVETWPMPQRHLYFPRVNRFTDADGVEIGGAYSLWVLLDVASRRIVGNDVVSAHLPDNADMPAGPGMPAAARPLGGDAARAAYAPVYTDFDLNGHVNNTRYLDWCCNALGAQALAARQLTAFDVCYEAEIRPGIEVRTELERDGDRFAFCGYDGEKRCFSVAGTLGERR